MKLSPKSKRVVVTRVVFGLLWLFSGVMGFLSSDYAPDVPEPMLSLTTSLWDSGVLQLAKVVEIVVGLMLVFGFFPALAVLMLVPLLAGIFVINLFLSPSMLPVPLLLIVVTVFLMCAYWKQYKPLFSR